MRTFLLYPRLAWDGLKKNRQLSLPYLMTCVAMTAVYYILGALASPETLALLPRGRGSVALVLSLGRWVMLIFSLIFLFYTSSFLTRRRAKEFGLYNVLGMGKWNLARISLWESAFTAALALLGGLALGVALSKLAELGLVNLMEGEIDYRLRLDGTSALGTTLFFSLIFALNAVAAMIRTARSSAVRMMQSESLGEKPPRGNWALAVLGLLLLAAAYVLAVCVENPVDALLWFFNAAIMTIAATYLLMISGSVRLCRILQGNKGYYYQPRHFVSLSSMAFRMKRNGAGLASICIISTMVLVMLSATTCLWFGTEQAILNRYPREINLETQLNDPAQLSAENLDVLRSACETLARDHGAAVENVQDFRYIYLTGQLQGAEIQCHHEYAEGLTAFGELRELYLISAGDYTAQTGQPLGLARDEALLLLDRCEYAADTLTLAMGEARNTFRVTNLETSAPSLGAGSKALITASPTSPKIFLVVPDLEAAIQGFPRTDSKNQRTLTPTWLYAFDTGLSDEENKAFGKDLTEALERLPSASEEPDRGWRGILVATRASGAEDYHASNNSFFFIGVALSAVFLLSAVLIIYYKQVSEGYEDARRFDIMQKVGMTRTDIRRSVSSQLLTVFALPLAFAALHLTFAFPMIRKILMLFALDDTALFLRTTLVSFAVFAAFYALVYRLTSGVYYRIVSGAGKGE